jgi:hypothetical protein
VDARDDRCHRRVETPTLTARQRNGSDRTLQNDRFDFRDLYALNTGWRALVVSPMTRPQRAARGSWIGGRRTHRDGDFGDRTSYHIK